MQRMSTMNVVLILTSGQAFLVDCNVGNEKSLVDDSSYQLVQDPVKFEERKFHMKRTLVSKTLNVKINRKQSGNQSRVKAWFYN